MFKGSLSTFVTLSTVLALSCSDTSSSLSSDSCHYLRKRSHSKKKSHHRRECSTTSSSSRLDCSTSESESESCSSSRSSSSTSSSDDCFRSKKHCKKDSDRRSPLKCSDKYVFIDFDKPVANLPIICDIFSCILPFISNVCPTPCRPYVEFNYVAVFLVSISGVADPKALYESRDLKLQKDAICETRSFANYDGLNTYFYNSDVNNGLACDKLVFDIQFMTYFLNRFEYFLSILIKDGAINPNVTLTAESITPEGSTDPVNLLVIPSAFVNDYESVTVVTAIFNTIINDTLSTETVVAFINILLIQVIKAHEACESENGDYNTSENYFDTLKGCLTRTLEIVSANYLMKANLLTLRNQFFIAVPAILNSGGTTPTITAISAFVGVDIQNIDLNKAISTF